MKRFKPRAQLRADANAILRSELHNLWNSWSWGLFRPLRNFIRKRQGFGKETEPIVDSEPQADSNRHHDSSIVVLGAHCAAATDSSDASPTQAHHSCEPGLRYSRIWPGWIRLNARFAIRCGGVVGARS